MIRWSVSATCFEVKLKSMMACAVDVMQQCNRVIDRGPCAVMQLNEEWRRKAEYATLILILKLRAA